MAGLDEAGRGAWAGPIVAGAVIFPIGTQLQGINDSKRLSTARRQERFIAITKTALAWGVGIVEANDIDRNGIQAANRRALLEALRRLPIQADHIVVDAFRLPLPSVDQAAFPKADGSVFSVAAASIIAKVVRDTIMESLDEAHPGYGFAQHKGYGTEIHRQAILTIGLSQFHRRSFCHFVPQAKPIDA